MNRLNVRRWGVGRLIALTGVVVVFAAVGLYYVAFSHADTLQPPAARVSKSLLRPTSLGTAPYQYIAYSGSMDATRQRTGTTNYFAAFVISSGGACTPSWGGTAAGELGGRRSGEIRADLAALRGAGGEAAVSFGGSNGTELAQACHSAASLADAYRHVVDIYSLKRIDFDIEGAALADPAATNRRSEAIASLQKSNPDLKIWLTLPVYSRGFTTDGLRVIQSLQAQGVVLSGINSMAMNYNLAIRDMGGQARTVAGAVHQQLSGLYPGLSSAEIWKAMGLTVMVGRNNTPSETFTLQDAAEVHDFAVTNKLGMLSMWSVDRDTSCPAADAATAQDAQPSVSCSGVDQQPSAFLRTLTIAAQP